MGSTPGLILDNFPQDIDDPSNDVSSFYLRTPMRHTDPVASKWKMKNDSFWYLGNDFFSRMDQASLTTADEFADSNFKIDMVGDLSSPMICKEPFFLMGSCQVWCDSLEFHLNLVKYCRIGRVIMPLPLHCDGARKRTWHLH